MPASSAGLKVLASQIRTSSVDSVQRWAHYFFLKAAALKQDPLLNTEQLLRDIEIFQFHGPLSREFFLKKKAQINPIFFFFFF